MLPSHEGLDLFEPWFLHLWNGAVMRLNWGTVDKSVLKILKCEWKLSITLAHWFLLFLLLPVSFLLGWAWMPSLVGCKMLFSYLFSACGFKVWVFFFFFCNSYLKWEILLYCYLPLPHLAGKSFRKYLTVLFVMHSDIFHYILLQKSAQDLLNWCPSY